MSTKFLKTEKSFLTLFLSVMFLLPFICFFILGGIGSKIIIIGSFCLIYLIASQALNLQVGYAGLLNLGAVAFVGIGGYTAGILLAVPGGHREAINSQCLDETGERVFTASLDRQIYSWDLQKGTKQAHFSGHKASVKAIALSKDGKRLVSVSEDKSVRVWDVQAEKLLKTFDKQSAKLSALCLLPDDQSCLIGDEAGNIVRLNLESGQVIGKYSSHYGTVTSLILSKDGKRLLSAATDNRILLWKLDNGQSKFYRELKAPAKANGVLSAQFLADETRIVAAYKDNQARLWSLSTGRVVRRFGKHTGPIEDLALSPDNKILVLASRDSTLSFHDLQTGKVLGTIGNHKGSVKAVHFTSDGKSIVTSSDDKTTRVWSIETLKEIRRLPIARWALVSFYKNLVPQFTGHSRWIFFFLDPNFLSYLTVTPVAVLLAALLGLGIGVPTLRLRGDYFAIVTLGFAQIVQLLVRNEEWLTYGTSGIKDLPGIVSFGAGENSIKFFAETGDYFLGLLFFAISLFLMIRVRDSRMGRAFMAIRDDELAAQSNGIHLSRYKIYNFLISSAVAALAGVVLVARSKVISPNDLLFWESILYLCCIVLGGLGSIRGAIVGGLIIGGLGELMRQMIAGMQETVAIPPQVRYILFAIILIAVMRFKPDGLHPAANEESERGEIEAQRHHAVEPSLFMIGGKNGAA
jgi:ABC-type branched-subunit amino acid transport system permease subunit